MGELSFLDLLPSHRVLNLIYQDKNRNTSCSFLEQLPVFLSLLICSSTNRDRKDTVLKDCFKYTVCVCIIMRTATGIFNV